MNAQTGCKALETKHRKIERFIESLWADLVDSMTVYSKGRIFSG